MKKIEVNQNLKKQSLLKSEKGFTMQDLIAALFIITLFVGIISSLMYSVYKTNVRADLTAQMATYAVQILEDIDRIPYEEVNSELASTYYDKFSIPGGMQIALDVSKYGEEVNAEDVMKIVKLNMSYTVENETEEFSVTRLKIKEK